MLVRTNCWKTIIIVIIDLQFTSEIFVVLNVRSHTHTHTHTHTRSHTHTHTHTHVYICVCVCVCVYICVCVCVCVSIYIYIYITQYSGITSVSRLRHILIFTKMIYLY